MMTQTDIHDTISKLKYAGEPFALATVVRTVSVTSAKTGAKAVIMADGSISEGWIGGGCAKGAVLKTARDVIQDGIPRLVSIQPEDLLKEIGVEAGTVVEGVKFATNMCPSQGTMDIFVEAILPKPEIVIFGASPVAIALSNLAGPLGFSRTICAEMSDHDKFGPMDAFINGFEYRKQSPGQRFAIISTQGRGDSAALKSALNANAHYIAFVGSQKKADKLKSSLSDEGFKPDQLAAIKAPAGLDICAITPEEIALSILAEITQKRRQAQYKNIQNNQ